MKNLMGIVALSVTLTTGDHAGRCRRSGPGS